MKITHVLYSVLATLLFAAGGPAWAGPGYRLIPLDDGSFSTQTFDLNRRGEIVGMRSVGGHTHAFRWRAGTFTDLHATIDPNAFYTQAAGINDRSVIVGDKVVSEDFEGFLLRGSQVSPIDVPGGQVFPFDINNRGQILVTGGNSSYLIDGATTTPLGGFPGGTDTINGVALNERGAVAGFTQTSGGTRAVLWQDGTVMDLGVVAGAELSFADDINDFNQVVGFVHIGGTSHAMRWQNGTMQLLPKLAGEQASGAQSNNNWGVIVGSTSLSGNVSTATLWWGNRVVELDRLVRADDVLKPFVHLLFANNINDRGDIVAVGVDSRTNNRIVYFMTLFAN